MFLTSLLGVLLWTSPPGPSLPGDFFLGFCLPPRGQPVAEG